MQRRHRQEAREGNIKSMIGDHDKPCQHLKVYYLGEDFMCNACNKCLNDEDIVHCETCEIPMLRENALEYAEMYFCGSFCKDTWSQREKFL